jgi:septal ring factor EnvC (AmiA/AmiB activator)
MQHSAVHHHNAELGHLNDDPKHTNTDLQRQLDKWQSLENKAEAEVDMLWKRQVELETQVKVLQDQVSEVEKKVGEVGRVPEKGKRRVEKPKEVLAEWQVSVGSPTQVCTSACSCTRPQPHLLYRISLTSVTESTRLPQRGLMTIGRAPSCVRRCAIS